MAEHPPGDILNFFSRSADKAPGKGAGEIVNDPRLYAQLAQIPNWRRVLSNFAVTPFRLDGKTYRTAEHAYHAKKFERWYPAVASQFAVESGNVLALGDGLDARNARKRQVMTADQLANWEARKGNEESRILTAKFGQDADARRILLATGDAQLWHRAPRAEKVRWERLEELRSRLRNEEAVHS